MAAVKEARGGVYRGPAPTVRRWSPAVRKWSPRKSLPEDFQVHTVTMSEITDPSPANTALDTNSTNALGGVGQGVLGCFTIETGEITMIQGGNWMSMLRPDSPSRGRAPGSGAGNSGSIHPCPPRSTGRTPPPWYRLPPPSSPPESSIA